MCSLQTINTQVKIQFNNKTNVALRLFHKNYVSRIYIFYVYKIIITYAYGNDSYILVLSKCNFVTYRNNKNVRFKR